MTRERYSLAVKDEYTTYNESGSAHDDLASHIVENLVSSILLFIYVTCLFGVLVGSLLKKISVIHPAIFMIFGFLVGQLSMSIHQVHKLASEVGNFNPNFMMNVFIPPIIFYASFDLDPQEFRKSFGQVMLLALPGFLMSAGLIAVFAVNLLNYNLKWYEGLIFGIILSATDPILSIASVKDIDAIQIPVLLETEALFNNPFSRVLSKLIADQPVYKSTVDGATQIFFRLILKLGVSPLFGLTMSKLTHLWLYHMANDEITEVSISVTVVYLTFYFAEWGGMSGVIAVTVVGLDLDTACFSPDTDNFLHRLFVVCLLSVCLTRIGYGFDWRTGAVIVWCGLRGAFTLTMALVTFDRDGLSEEVKSKLLILTAGATLLNIFINAASMRIIVRRLGFRDVSPAKRMAMYSIIQRLHLCASTALSMLKMDRYLADANWSMVEVATYIEDPYYTNETNVTLEELFPELLSHMCPDCQKEAPPEPTPNEIADMVDEARLRMIKAQVISYWKQYDAGLLNRETTMILVNATEQYVDRKGKFMNIHEVKKCWEAKGFFVFLRKRVEAMVYHVKEEAIRPSPIRALKICYRIVCRNEFELIIYSAILMNTCPVSLNFVPEMELAYESELLVLNYIFVAFFIAEATMKILALRKFYFIYRWNRFDFYIVLIGTADMIIQCFLSQFALSKGSIVKYIVQVLRFLRLLRAVRLVKVLMPRLLKLLNKKVNKQLSFGYDIAKGFVVGEEDVKIVIDQICDNKKVTQRLKSVIEKDRQDGMQELGLLQRDNPAIVIAAKTSQAIRTVLNSIKDTLQGLRAGGIVDRFQGEKIDKILKLKMRQLKKFPTTIPTPTAEQLLRNVPWLENSKHQTMFIKSKAKILFFDYGDLICREGEAPRGVHLIVSGLVKLYGSNPLFGHSTTEKTVREHIDKKGTDKRQKVPFTDYRGIGTILGEVNCLTKQKMEVSIVCETAVQTCFIGINELFEAFDVFLEHPSLEYKIWMAIAVRTALNTFKESLAYQNWTSTKMYSWLANAYVEDIELNKKLDVYDGTMEDAILVYGSVNDCDLLEPYYAPVIVPKIARQIQGTANITKLLIIPGTSDPNVRMSPSDQFNCTSALCLQHAAARRRAKSGRLSVSIAVSESLTALTTTDSVTDLKTHGGTEAKPDTMSFVTKKEF